MVLFSASSHLMNVPTGNIGSYNVVPAATLQATNFVQIPIKEYGTESAALPS